MKLYLQRTQLTISSLEGGGGIPKHRGELLRWHALVRRLEAGEQGAVRHRVTDLGANCLVPSFAVWWTRSFFCFVVKFFC